jgi:hypothetical protein
MRQNNCSPKGPQDQGRTPIHLNSILPSKFVRKQSPTKGQVCLRLDPFLPMIPLMKSIKPWVNEMGVTEAQMTQWSREAPKGKSLTYWCLENGKIPTDEYLFWARNHYGLAVLKPEFFEQSPNFDLWRNIASVANWSAEMVPLHEWDGVVFVGCVEPLDDISWSFPVRYIIADAQSLASSWQTLQTGPAVQRDGASCARSTGGGPR